MNASYPHPIIAREGWPFLAATVVLAVASGWLIGWWSAPLWLAVLFVLQFFRDPPRQAPGDAHTVVSPADGRIVAVERARDPYLERNAIKVSVFMNVFNVHSNRSPVDGHVQKRQHEALPHALGSDQVFGEEVALPEGIRVALEEVRRATLLGVELWVYLVLPKDVDDVGTRGLDTQLAKLPKDAGYNPSCSLEPAWWNGILMWV